MNKIKRFIKTTFGKIIISVISIIFILIIVIIVNSIIYEPSLTLKEVADMTETFIVEKEFDLARKVCEDEEFFAGKSRQETEKWKALINEKIDREELHYLITIDNIEKAIKITEINESKRIILQKVVEQDINIILSRNHNIKSLFELLKKWNFSVKKIKPTIMDRYEAFGGKGYVLAPNDLYDFQVEEIKMREHLGIYIYESDNENEVYNEERHCFNEMLDVILEKLIETKDSELIKECLNLYSPIAVVASQKFSRKTDSGKLYNWTYKEQNIALKFAKKRLKEAGVVL